jgi:hypothetical protein
MTDTPKPITTPVARLQGLNDRDGGYAADKTLRDEIAISALNGMLASSPVTDRRDPDQVNHAGWAQNAYRFADAMLAAREAR